ncbi:hypothetical protein CONCODRAFT_13602 [Conidiobolus coronatus NRRL 28638]|uniref:Retrotransposon gag domain-containing protein n=1 Tax=Conidiobolus coronatus (strain ATCC 28846 / CBS 209.66 / NRRL 28638) TaxID=796925 RepID=A0A137NQE5_CONC2|nr:hypothetical protein CONCODRAFT_13602 [Conidiobolus coronatus NRRL 28638]|eukprot:KXN64979.1 hypothetical protein CONCODRAFT_13602 [Conidiobolus coronatus NRRL 28638]
MYNNILNYQIYHSIHSHNGNPILTIEYFSICNSEINPKPPKVEKKKLFVQNLTGKAEKWYKLLRKQALTFEEKEKFKKAGICFYCKGLSSNLLRGEDLSSKLSDKLLMINKTSPTLNTQQIDPSHLILNIQLNNHGTLTDHTITPIQNLNGSTLNPNQLLTITLNITVRPSTIQLSFKISESLTPTILGQN